MGESLGRGQGELDDSNVAAETGYTNHHKKSISPLEIELSCENPLYYIHGHFGHLQ